MMNLCLNPDESGQAAAARDGSGVPSTLRRRITNFGLLLAHPMAFLVVGVYGALWFLIERNTFNWNAVATLSIWLMTLFIQRVGHRDTQAIQAKLDELLHVQVDARNSLTRIDEKEPEDIVRHRAEARKDD